jgi:cell division septal protein FtsQ
MAQRRFKRPYRAKKRKPLIFKAPFWFTILLISAFAGGISFACFSPWLQVTDIKISGAQTIGDKNIASTIEASAKKQLVFLPSKSILLFNLGQAKQELLKQFPEAADIQIKRQFPSTIYAAVMERSPIAAVDVGDGSFYIIDDTGVFFKKSPDNSGLFEINAGFGGPELKTGAVAVAKDLLQKILRTKVSIENNAGVKLAQAAIKNGERIDFTTAEGWQIFVNPQGDLDWQVSKLAAVAADPAFIAQRKTLDYVDLRFTRVYVKQK